MVSDKTYSKKRTCTSLEEEWGFSSIRHGDKLTRKKRKGQVYEGDSVLKRINVKLIENIMHQVNSMRE